MKKSGFKRTNDTHLNKLTIEINLNNYKSGYKPNTNVKIYS